MTELSSAACQLLQRLLDLQDQSRRSRVGRGRPGVSLAADRDASAVLRVMTVVAGSGSDGASLMEVAAATLLTGPEARDTLAHLAWLGYVEEVPGRQPSRWRLPPGS